MFISVLMLRGLQGELQARGLPCERLLSGSGIGAERVANLRGWLTLAEWESALRIAYELTSDPGLGLSVGMNSPQSMLQLLGHLVISASTIREACGLFARYSLLLSANTSCSLTEHGDVAELRIEQDDWGESIYSRRFRADFSVAFALRIGKHFAPGTRPSQVSFRHDAPSYRERYLASFDCPVRFRQPVDGVSFPRAFVDVPHVHSDQTMHAILLHEVEQLRDQQRRSGNVSQQVRALLRIPATPGKVSLAQAARRLGLSTRALRRRLHLEGYTLLSIVAEERYRLACDELRQSTDSLQQIADRLGYSEMSSFLRAFRRWAGTTPAQFRRAAQREQSFVGAG